MQYAFRSLFIVVLAATGFFAATALPSSATGTQPVRGTAIVEMEVLAAEKADFSTLRGIKRYLRAIGVDPRSVVIQRGKRNYAGPNCPGAGWNCTNAQQVMQLGTQNTSECIATPPTATKTDMPPTLQECVIFQGPAAKNVAKCIQKSKRVPFVRQRCSVTQNGNFNEATIVQVADQTGGAIQGALQEVGVLQNATGSTNRLQVDQEIKQLTETTEDAVVQDQDAYQVVTAPFAAGVTPPADMAAMQNAVGRGDNGSQIVQTQIQRAKGGVTQTQNDGEFGAGVLLVEPFDCNLDPLSVEDPNACVNLEQSALNGINGPIGDHQGQGQLTQTIDQEATTTELGTTALNNVLQQQGAGPFEGGADGRVHQVIGPGGTGKSQDQANQSETMKLWAPLDPDPEEDPDVAPEQDQFGGASCCGVGSQVGGSGNFRQVNQKKLLEAFGGGLGTVQVATLVGSTSSSPPGAGGCAVNHDAQTKSDTNSDQATASESREPCPVLVVFTVCQNTGGDGPEVGACEEAVVCEVGDTPDIDVSEGDVDVSCDEGNGGPSLAGVTEPAPLSSTPLDSPSQPRSLSVLRR